MDKVMICIPTGEYGRIASFHDYVSMLDKPEGTMITTTHGQSPARGRNIMIESAIQNGATHCLFIDDDMAFKADTLKRLLAHDKDIVSGLYVMRAYPHHPVIFDEAYDDGKCRFSFLNRGRGGLVEVVNLGLGMCLIKTEVFLSMAKPWITLGECEKDHWCDDISFFNRARKAGFKMYCDLDVVCGHSMTAFVWPKRAEDGSWHTLYNTGGNDSFQVPQVTPPDEELESARGDLKVEYAVTK